jgi:hypothetical protein
VGPDTSAAVVACLHKLYVTSSLFGLVRVDFSHNLGDNVTTILVDDSNRYNTQMLQHPVAAPAEVEFLAKLSEKNNRQTKLQKCTKIIQYHIFYRQ